MSDIALRFLLANAAAAAAIVLVLILRKPARALFGASLAYALWALVPLAALASLLPPRIVEIAQPSPEPPAAFVSERAPLEFLPSERLPLPSVSPTPAPAIEAVAPAQPFDPWALGFLVWFAGALAMLAWQLRNQSRFMADARAGFAGPAVAGFLRPRIVTPSDFEQRFDEPERQMILAHERIHISRNDARINALAALARCLCWFNPLIHLAAHLMRIDQELACDAAVIRRHPKARAAYASALLKAQLASRPLPLGCYWPARSEHPLTERVEMLKQTPPNGIRRIAGATGLAGLALGASLSAWAALPPEERMTQIAPSSAATAISLEQMPALNDQPQPPDMPQTAIQPQLTIAAPQAPSPLPPLPLKAGDELYLRGKIERIDFRNTSYVAFLRASGAGPDYGPAAPHVFGAQGPLRPILENTSLWELSPTALFGDPAAIKAELLDKPVEASVTNINPGCKPTCKVKLNQLLTSRSSEVPEPTAGASIVSEFGRWYNTTQRAVARGTVERVEFHDQVFDAYIRTVGSGFNPGGLVQARSEYTLPRPDIEQALVGQTVTASGWRARENIATFCEPVCGMYASSFEFPDSSTLTPLGERARTPSPYLQRPRGQLFMSVADLNAPVTLRGKILRYVSDPRGENPQLWIEASGALPETTVGSRAGTTWVVAGFPFEPHETYDPSDSTHDLRLQAAQATAHVAELARRYGSNHPEMAVASQEKAALEARIADQLWVDKNVVIRGFNVEDKRCQPQCMLAGDSIAMGQ